MTTHDAPSTAPETTAETLELVGGDLCLDFANTVGGTRDDPKEKLHTYADLVRWGARAGAVDPEASAELLDTAADRAAEAAVVLVRALELREAIYRIFAAVGKEADPAREDLEILNAELTRALPNLRIELAGNSFDYRFASGAALDRPLWAIARSAAELLASGEINHIKGCSSDDCTWLFLDRSRNQSRRWCDMKDCGNRAKARRHYHRKKRASG